MKLPEDIKRALGCGATSYSCKECAYNTDNCFDEVEMDALKYIEQLESRLVQVEKERDAALKDLKSIGECWYCKYDKLNTKNHMPDICRRCCSKNNFEWRGVCEEE